MTPHCKQTYLQSRPRTATKFQLVGWSPRVRFATRRPVLETERLLLTSKWPAQLSPQDRASQQLTRPALTTRWSELTTEWSTQLAPQTANLAKLTFPNYSKFQRAIPPTYIFGIKLDNCFRAPPFPHGVMPSPRGVPDFLKQKTPFIQKESRMGHFVP